MVGYHGGGGEVLGPRSSGPTEVLASVRHRYGLAETPPAQVLRLGVLSPLRSPLGPSFECQSGDSCFLPSRRFSAPARHPSPISVFLLCLVLCRG